MAQATVQKLPGEPVTIDLDLGPRSIKEALTAKGISWTDKVVKLNGNTQSDLDVLLQNGDAVVVTAQTKGN